MDSNALYAGGALVVGAAYLLSRSMSVRPAPIYYSNAMDGANMNDQLIRAKWALQGGISGPTLPLQLETRQLPDRGWNLNSIVDQVTNEYKQAIQDPTPNVYALQQNYPGNSILTLKTQNASRVMVMADPNGPGVVIAPPVSQPGWQGMNSAQYLTSQNSPFTLFQ